MQVCVWALFCPNDTQRGIFYCKWTPCSCSVFCYCCHLNLWSLPSGYQLQPSRGLTFIHRKTLLPSLTSLKWTRQRDLICIHRVAGVGQILNLKHNSSIRDIFSPRPHFNCFVHFALATAAAVSNPPQNSHVLAGEHVMPSALPCRCMWMPRLSRSGGCVAFTILSRLLKLSV